MDPRPQNKRRSNLLFGVFGKPQDGINQLPARPTQLLFGQYLGFWTWLRQLWRGTLNTSSIWLRICFNFPMLVLKGIYDYWIGGLEQMEDLLLQPPKSVSKKQRLGAGRGRVRSGFIDFDSVPKDSAPAKEATARGSEGPTATGSRLPWPCLF